MNKFQARIKKEFKKKDAFIKKGRKNLVLGIKKIKEFKFQLLNLYLLIISLASWALFLFFEMLLRMYNAYKYYYWMDIPSHFFAGIAIASSALWLSCFSKGEFKNSFVLISVFIASALWEITETIGDWILPGAPYLRDYFIWDGFWDIIFAMLGAVFFLLIFRKHIRRKLRKYILEVFK